MLSAWNPPTSRDSNADCPVVCTPQNTSTSSPPNWVRMDPCYADKLAELVDRLTRLLKNYLHLPGRVQREIDRIIVEHA
jgi:hypothetical protein